MMRYDGSTTLMVGMNVFLSSMMLEMSCDRWLTCYNGFL
jgi:hypothetical protein